MSEVDPDRRARLGTRLERDRAREATVGDDNLDPARTFSGRRVGPRGRRTDSVTTAVELIGAVPAGDLAASRTAEDSSRSHPADSTARR
jgi:hypothetical protein